MTRKSAEDRSRRRTFIGGSDARIIMGGDEEALLPLWHEKRGELEPKDLSGNLVVQLGAVTEDLNRRWYETNTGQVIIDIQAANPPSGAALDGGHALWTGSGQRGRVRGQIHAALVVLGRNGGGEIHAATAAQYMGSRGTISRLVRHNWRRQMGRDHEFMLIRSTDISLSPPNENSGAASRTASPLPCWGSNLQGRALRRFASWT